MLDIEITSKLDRKKVVSLIPFFPDEISKGLRRAFRGLSPAQKRAVRNVFKNGTLPKSGVFPVYSVDKMVLVHFLAEKKNFTRRDAYEAGFGISDVTKRFKLTEINVLSGGLSQEYGQSYSLGLCLGTYEFLDYKKKSQKPDDVRLKKIIFYGSKNEEKEKRFKTLFEALKLTKDLINIPPSDSNPDYVEALTKRLYKELRHVSLKIFNAKDLKKMGCNGILGVGKASMHEPRLIILNYAGGKKEAPIVLVGKCVTYDTGGLNIKTSSMRTMKQDLAGAATMLGALYFASKLGLKKNIIVVIPVVENAINEKSYKPDDVLTMHNGKTVEVTNTDAEGRLILADALSYADEHFKPRAMVDAATLTGACMYAVGDDIIAALSNNSDLLLALKKASSDVDEPLWELPLHEKYKKQFESSIADIVNNTKKLRCGTIEGGLFLQHFVSEKTPWCHLDIASVAFDENANLATGRGVRMMVEFLEQY